MRKVSALEEFKGICQGYYSVYVVANEGMSVLGKQWQVIEGFSPQEMFRIKDEDSGAIVSEQPNHRMQIGMSYNGPSSQILAHGIINWIYAIWETRFRERIAKEFGCEPSEITSNVMGDMRVLRNLISHEFAITDLAKHKFAAFSWIPDGPVILHKRDMDKILLAINNMDLYVKNEERVST